MSSVLEDLLLVLDLLDDRCLPLRLLDDLGVLAVDPLFPRFGSVV